MSGADDQRAAVLRRNACRSCRRPVYLLDGVGWVHGEVRQYAHEPITCTHPVPVDDEDHQFRGER